jgi:hypothetical protein
VGGFPDSTVYYANSIIENGKLSLAYAPEHAAMWTWQSSYVAEMAYPVASILTSVLSQITGLGISLFTVLPFNLFFLLPYPLLAWKVTKNAWFSFFYFFVYLFILRVFLFDQAYIFRATLGWALFGFFVLVFVTQRISKKSMLLMALFAISLDYTYYGTAIFIPLILGVLAICFLFKTKLTHAFTHQPFNVIALLSLEVISLGFLIFGPTLVYLSAQGVYFASLGSYLSNVFQNFFGALLTSLGLGNYLPYVENNSLPLSFPLSALINTQKLAYLLVIALVAFWFIYGLRGSIRTMLAGSKNYEFLIALVAVTMVLGNLLTYGALTPTSSIVSAIPIGGLLIWPSLKKRFSSITREGILKSVAICAIIMVVLGSITEVAIVVNTGWRGVYPRDSSLIAPLGHWYASFSSGEDVATGNTGLTSLMLNYNPKGSVEEVGQSIFILSAALQSHNQSGILTALSSVQANMYVLTPKDASRPSWGDNWGDVVSSMPYSSWFYNLPTTNIIYNSLEAQIDYLGSSN